MRVGLALAAVAVAAVLWSIPWADAMMTAVATVSTDEGVVASRTIRKVFAQRSASPTTVRIALDLADLEGKLVRLGVQGKAVPRASTSSAVGSVACAAELVGPDGGN